MGSINLSVKWEPIFSTVNNEAIDFLKKLYNCITSKFERLNFKLLIPLCTKNNKSTVIYKFKRYARVIYLLMMILKL